MNFICQRVFLFQSSFPLTKLPEKGKKKTYKRAHFTLWTMSYFLEKKTNMGIENDWSVRLLTEVT